MINSITESTLKQYQGPLKLWRNFAVQNQVNVYNAKTPDIIKFLTTRFNNGASYSTLNTARSAIALVSSRDIHKDGLISRFLKGTFKKRPTKPRYNTTWDTSSVLTYMENLHPLSQLKLREATEKVATLLALTTAHRLQTLSLINVDNIVFSESGITIKIPDLIKTSKPSTSQPELILPFFKEKPSLCVASAILDYLKITKDFRTRKNKKLLISTIKPYKDASAQTIGHWIKSLLNKAGIDTKIFTAYSTRHAAVSAAFRNKINIDTIRRTAGWSARSQMFAKFYNKPILPPNDKFARSILEN